MGVSRAFALAVGLASAAISAPFPTFAQEQSALPPTPVAKYLKGIRGQVNELVHLKGGNCVDPGATGFVCRFDVAGQVLMVKAAVLGPDTPIEIAEALIGPCKGTANLTSKNCRFDVEITATNINREMIATDSGSKQLVVVHSNMIDMYSPR